MKGITDRAARALQEALDKEHVPAGKCVRFIGSACGGELEIDREYPDDQVFKYGGRPVFVIGPETVKTCGEQIAMDYAGGHFRFVQDKSPPGRSFGSPLIRPSTSTPAGAPRSHPC